MKHFAIFDLDNCLSNDLHRIPLIDWTQPNPEERYAAYHAACGNDAPGNMDLYRAVTATRQAVFLTARPTTVALQTRAWISRHLGITHATLLMRNAGDNRPSVDVKRWQLDMLPQHYGVPLENIDHAYDDRQDIIDMYRGLGLAATRVQIHDVCAYTKPQTAPASTVTAADILQEMANTFRERNAVYGDNFKMVAKLVAVLFPKGVPSELVTQDQWHLFELALVKLSRYAISNLTHKDSVRDLGVYAAMCEAILTNQERT